MEPEIIEIKYDPEEDILNVFFSKNKIDDSFDVDPHAIMHVDEKNKPVYLEIFEASRNFNVNLTNLAQKIKQEFLTPV
ncbi:MAG: hypothetical protein A3F33_00655 [Candidatus Woykebacteria bacterium RIFCSPHIGHO2_12_FULL_43_10]|nr:MAG: hypothetical protein A3F33_00655 [Candidatus Woykebacteria bacterium RIFCSPHIGHO2_12_FULL_43_10]